MCLDLEDFEVLSIYGYISRITTKTILGITSESFQPNRVTALPRLVRPIE